MEKQIKRVAKILYRSGKYSTWSPASITIPEGVTNIEQYCTDDLEKMGIEFNYITIQKIVKTLK